MRLAKVLSWRALQDRVLVIAADRPNRLFALQVFFLAALDLLTKIGIKLLIPLGEFEYLFDHLLLIGHVEHEVGRRLPMLVGVSLFFAAICAFRFPSKVPLLRYPFALQLGGAFGNTIETALLGSATNWIAIFPDWRQTIFNFADLLIFVGSIGILIGYCRWVVAHFRERGALRERSTMPASGAGLPQNSSAQSKGGS
ncbi:signal peptidase II [Burkholderiales bacterium]|nr:MAG: signal peptidase II [Burkholderiales bacterium]CAG1003429.1 signal peptidase II [Burkholderiales bacterium]